MKAHAIQTVAPVDKLIYTNFILPQNKIVGFNDLILNYQKFFRRGFEIAVVIHLVFIFSYMGIMKYLESREIENTKQIQQRVITLSDLEPPPSVDEEEVPPPKDVESISAPPKDLSALTPEPVAKDKAELQTIKTQKELEEIKTPVSNVGDENSKLEYSGPVKIEEKKVEEKLIREEKNVEPEKTVFQSFEVEKAPECINLGQVKSSMDYPSVAREAGIEGRVTVKVLVGPDGSVIKVGSVSGPEVFHNEVREKSMNLEFTPGLQNGKPVKVWITVPFNFKLTN
jgi:protein TonB